MKPPLRLPLFDDDFLFLLQNEVDVTDDIPDVRWIDPAWRPEREFSRASVRYDSIAEREIFRLFKFQTCPFCRENMKELKTPTGKVFVCTNCFYWAGRGNRPMVSDPLGRAILGRLHIVDNPEEAPLDLLINHLSENSDKLFGLTPGQAEKILPPVLSDYLKCEVIAIGGVKDKGIDALVIRGENEKMLIQIKWRQEKDVAEAVSVVREVGGTLMTTGIPNGMLVSTRPKFSPDAIEAAKVISQRDLVGIGKINMELKAFNDILDMFEVSSMVRKEDTDPKTVIPDYDDGWHLFGSH